MSQFDSVFLESQRSYNCFLSVLYLAKIRKCFNIYDIIRIFNLNKVAGGHCEVGGELLGCNKSGYARAGGMEEC